MNLATQVTATSRHEAVIAGIAAILWLAILVLLHIIKPNLKPSIRMMSEYAIKPRGWIMQVAFFCVAVSCYVLALALWPYVSHIGLVLLIIVGIGFTGAGAFVTDPLMRKGSATTSGTLHNIFSFIAIPLLPVTSTVLSVNMVHNIMWSSTRAWLPVLSVLTWVGLISFLGGTPIYALLLHRRASTGYLQRFMVLTYTVWLIVATIIVSAS
jgi:Protein of unknown function (DUF998)